MTDYKLYPNLPPLAPPENPQVAYHLSIIQAKMQGLKNKEQMFKQKYEKYTKILNRLTWLNACSSGISIATGISSVATFATFVGLPVSMALGTASLTGAIASGIISMLTKKYQKKLKKVTRLVDIVTQATVVFEYGSKYKYILAGIDAASRYKVARPLRTKKARDVAEMIADIYKVGPLKYPKISQCDNGSEFKGDVTKMLEKQDVIQAHSHSICGSFK